MTGMPRRRPPTFRHPRRKECVKAAHKLMRWPKRVEAGAEDFVRRWREPERRKGTARHEKVERKTPAVGMATGCVWEGGAGCTNDTSVVVVASHKIRKSGGSRRDTYTRSSNFAWTYAVAHARVPCVMAAPFASHVISIVPCLMLRFNCCSSIKRIKIKLIINFNSVLVGPTTLVGLDCVGWEELKPALVFLLLLS